ncbi:PREDICTED: uncharacterized protein LOC106814230 [Priapulus caudatus]|uniref:Uncharacterized protein LOC106814230 n=1 Tax=Priapulus caudatus TaxID=37621 RepID=A0ABM1EP93_PRICU|nr:PREDICTED: uncharacterized protein LOC106814230 [Priapulus caudatus]
MQNLFEELYEVQLALPKATHLPKYKKVKKFKLKHSESQSENLTRSLGSHTSMSNTSTDSAYISAECGSAEGSSHCTGSSTVYVNEARDKVSMRVNESCLETVSCLSEPPDKASLEFNGKPHKANSCVNQTASEPSLQVSDVCDEVFLQVNEASGALATLNLEKDRPKSADDKLKLSTSVVIESNCEAEGSHTLLNIPTAHRHSTQKSHTSFMFWRRKNKCCGKRVSVSPRIDVLLQQILPLKSKNCHVQPPKAHKRPLVYLKRNLKNRKETMKQAMAGHVHTMSRKRKLCTQKHNKGYDDSIKKMKSNEKISLLVSGMEESCTKASGKPKTSTSISNETLRASVRSQKTSCGEARLKRKSNKTKTSAKIVSGQVNVKVAVQPTTQLKTVPSLGRYKGKAIGVCRPNMAKRHPNGASVDVQTLLKLRRPRSFGSLSQMEQLELLSPGLQYKQTEKTLSHCGGSWSTIVKEN